jgi:uncharacterized protein (DUF1697 family)
MDYLLLLSSTRPIMHFVALLRGVNSGQNPVVKMDALRQVFEKLGFDDVRTILASGNVIFDAGTQTEDVLVRLLEPALTKALRYDVKVLVRSAAEIRRLIAAQPFAAAEKRAYVTFLRKAPGRAALRQFTAAATTIDLRRTTGRDICYGIDLAGPRTPDAMRLLEKHFGKEITTRGWPTVVRCGAALPA